MEKSNPKKEFYIEKMPVLLLGNVTLQLVFHMCNEFDFDLSDNSYTKLFL